MSQNPVLDREQMNIVIVGHVDHGKSTVIGRLLADTNSLPDGKLEQVRKECERTSKPFEYAFLLDALEDEQSQGITIDMARVFFKTSKRNYLIIDAPGHIEFLKNMITGASRAEAALLVIDANEGIMENSRRHGYLLSLLGIRQIAVIVNKIDLLGYDQKAFDSICADYGAFLAKLKVTASAFIPASGREGDNIANKSTNMPWYKGPTVLQELDAFKKETESNKKALRLPVQDVYKFTRFADSRRLIAGTIESGSVAIGDELIFLPSGKKSAIKSFEKFNPASDDKLTSLPAGWAASLTLTEQIYIQRGEIAAKIGDVLPHVTTRFKASIFWLGKKSMMMRTDYLLKLGTAKIVCRLDEIIKVIDASNLHDSQKSQIDRHDVAECVIATNRPLAFDLASELAGTSRFVIVDDFEIVGGGIALEALSDKQAWVREHIMLRNLRWEKSLISPEIRANRYNQKAVMVLISGSPDAPKKELAKRLEEDLFSQGKFVYFINLSNIMVGLDADIGADAETYMKEHMRRLAEIAFILLDAGIILIVSANDLYQEDLEILKAAVSSERLLMVWHGDKVTTDVVPDIRVSEDDEREGQTGRIIEALKEQGVIFRVW